MVLKCEYLLLCQFSMTVNSTFWSFCWSGNKSNVNMLNRASGNNDWQFSIFFMILLIYINNCWLQPKGLFTLRVFFFFVFFWLNAVVATLAGPQTHCIWTNPYSTPMMEQYYLAQGFQQPTTISTKTIKVVKPDFHRVPLWDKTCLSWYCA